jgi:hypothetical protein
MPATAPQARSARDAARGPETDRRRQWLDHTAAVDTDDESLFAGAPPARPSTPRPAAPRPAAPAPVATPVTPLMPLAPTPIPVRGAVAAPTWRLAAYGAAALAAVLVIYFVLSTAIHFAQVTADDVAYGRPRTSHLDAYFGHAGEQAGQPSHVLAINLERRVVIIELPGGDTQGASTLTGPYLFGSDEDLTPIKLSSADINGDGQPDLLVDVKNEQLVYINDKDKNSFHLLTNEERAKLQPASQGGGPPSGGQK